ncbi:SpaA isopeptide-forming pilin-related protein [Gemelliphila palaticanis]|uniref:Cna B-type domain-containing protein n=1 Tax=Gemelliphila palaticanis TaxID=81950 RepID=A0ABX2SYN9_9BACL|nr:SpaA isopeptide-forming pilin-related protein [Gemella palaticanis]MBF0715207.1 Cna B-type domain-containing protein [Gemella palaticanis]NYS47137.1 Cna B-type domain-containing protein [Gemella palaticanis]
MKNHKKTLKKIMSVFMVMMILLVSIFSDAKVSYSADGTFKLVLREQGTRNTIPNARFKIYKKSDRSKSWTATTNSSGYFEINLPEDVYVITQETTAPGFVKETGELSRTVYGDVKTMFVMENNRVGSNGITSNGVTTLRLKVVNSKNTAEVIPNAKFAVKSRLVNTTITSGPDGYAYLNGLEEGETYTITQIGEVDGYIPKPDDTTVYIPAPAGAKYPEFADVTIGNMPYDKGSFGILTLHTEEDYKQGGTKGKRIPNVKLKITDDLGNVQIGVTDENGTLKVKNVSFLRTYKAEILEVPYEYHRAHVFVENIKINQVGNTQTQTLYIPPSPKGILTINNTETGDFGVKISGGKFRLIHPDGTSREFTINNGVQTFNVPFTEGGKYKLIQLSSDNRHNIIGEPIEFEMSRPVEINVQNNLKDPSTEKTTVTVNKVWGDKPGSNISTKIKLYANGELVPNKEITVNSRDGNVKKYFRDLPKYDDKHQPINYTVKIDSINDWYTELDNPTYNEWTFTSYEGSLTGVCYVNPSKGLIFYSTANNVYMTENGDVLKKTLSFPQDGRYDPSFGHGVAYDRINGNLYGVNKDGYLSVIDVYKGPTGTVTKTVKLAELFEDAKQERVDGEFIQPNFRKVNTLETTIDGKYLIGRTLQGNNLYFYRISDIISASVGEGGTVRAAKTVYARHALANQSNAPVVDGDIIQLNNGDIVYSGHENQFFEGTLSAPQRSNYKFWLLKYRGNTNDVASGSYDRPIAIGQLENPGAANNWRDGQTFNFDKSIEGLVYVGGKLFFTSNQEHKGQTVEWNLGIVDNFDHYVNNPNPNAAIPFRLHSLKNTGQSNKVRTQDQINKYFGGSQALVNRITAFNSQFADMTGASREHCDPEVKVKGKKNWVGDNETVRPSSIEVQLYADGQPYVAKNGASSKATISAENGWAYQFLNLPKVNDRGQRINYTVREVSTPNNYLVEYNDNNITNIYLKGGFSIKKTNADKSQTLSGASFSLWNEDKSKQIVGSQVTTSNGILSFDNLPAGTYTLIEDTAPHGYRADNKEYKVVGTVNQQTKKVDFVVTANGTNVDKDGDNFVIKNSVPSFKVKLFKIDDTTNEKINLTSRFEFLDSSKQKLQDAELVDGEFLLTGTFASGKYYLREVEAPDEYIRIEEDIEINIDGDGRVYLGDNQANFVAAFGIDLTKNDTIELRVRNRKEDQRGRFVINKTGSDSPASMLPGARFSLIPTDEQGRVKQGEQAIEKTSDNKGRVIYSGLNPGFYRLEELEAPQNYTKTTRTWKIEVKTNGKTIITENPQVRSAFRSVELGDNFNSMFRMARSGNLPLTQNVNATDLRDFTLKQTISQASAPGKYKVDVEIVDKRDNAEIVVIVEDTNSSDRDVTRRYKYRDDASAIGYVKNNLLANLNIPNAKVTIIGANSVATTYVERQTKDQALANFTHMNGGDESNRNGLKAAFEKAQQIMQNSNAKNKTVVALTGRTISNQVENTDFAGIEGIINNLQDNLKVSVMATSEFIYRTVRGQGGNDQANFRDLLPTLGVDEGTFDDGRIKGYTKAFAQLVPERQMNRNPRAIMYARDANIHAAYESILPGIATKINENFDKARTVTPNIRLSSNVVFDRLENANGIAHNAGTITGTVNIPANNTVRFSYYVNSNLSSNNINYNVLENINASANMSENVYGTTGNFPIPKANIPGLTINVSKSWDNNILASDKVEATAVLKKGNQEVQRIVLAPSRSRGTFRTVPKFDANGRNIDYKVEEIQNSDILSSRNVPTTLNGNTSLSHNVNITTSYTTTSIRATKNWVSTEERDKLPVTVKLIAKVGDRVINVRDIGRQIPETKILNAQNSWTATFDNLPRVHNGAKLEYSVEETNVGTGENRLDYYEVSYTNGSESTVITNKKSPEVTVVNTRVNYKFKIKKVAYDNENQLLTGNSNTSARILILDSQKHPILGESANLTNGELIFQRNGSKYSPGVYYIKEERAPETYKLLDKLVKIEITEAGDVRILGYENENDDTLTTDDNMATISKSQTDSELIEIKVKNKKKKYPIKIVKIDTNGDKITTSETRFAIKSADSEGTNNVVNIGGEQNSSFRNGEHTFNPNGEGFPAGIYYIREISPPSGYVGLNRNIKVEITEQGVLKVDNQNISVGTDGLDKQDIKVGYDNNGLITLQVKNPKVVDFSIRKLNDNTNSLLNGVRFKLAPKDRNTPDPAFDNLNWHRNNMDGSEGTEQIDGQTRKVIRWTHKNDRSPGLRVQEGVYVLTEESAPNTHEPIKPFEILVDSTGVKANPGSDLEIKPNTVEWPSANTSGRPNIIIRNFKRPQITIEKVGEDGITKLAGVRLKIKSKDDATPKPLFDYVTWHERNMSAIIPSAIDEKWISWQTHATEVPGLVLREGTYIVEEESVPDGYAKFKPFEISVNQAGEMTVQNNTNKQGIVSNITQDSGAQRLRLVLKNEKNPKVKIKKVSTLGNTPLDGVKFQLFEADGNTPIGEEKTTANKGVVEFDNLVINKYYIIKETQTLSTHVLNDKKYRFKINTDGNIEVDNKDDKFVIENKELSTNVVLIKNEPKENEYPATGGFGTILTTIFGLLIASVSSAMIYRRKRQG